MRCLHQTILMLFGLAVLPPVALAQGEGPWAAWPGSTQAWVATADVELGLRAWRASPFSAEWSATGGPIKEAALEIEAAGRRIWDFGGADWMRHLRGAALLLKAAPGDWMLVAGHDGDTAWLDGLARPRGAEVVAEDESAGVRRLKLRRIESEPVSEADLPGARRQVVRELTLWIGPERMALATGPLSAGADSPLGWVDPAARLAPVDTPGLTGGVRLEPFWTHWLKGRTQGSGDLIRMDQLGLEGLREVAFELRLDPDRTRLDLTLQAAPEAGGIAHLLLLGSGSAPLELAERVPGHAIYANFGRYPINEAWPTLRQTLARAMPAAGVAFEGTLETLRQATGVDFEQDLIARLDGRVVRFATIEGSPAMQPVATLMLGLNGPDAFREALGRVVTHLGTTYGLYDVQGIEGRRWILTPPTRGVSVEPLLFVFFTEDAVLISRTGSGPRAATDPGGPTLADRPDVMRALMAPATPEAHWRSYADLGRLRESLEASLLGEVATAQGDPNLWAGLSRSLRSMVASRSLGEGRMHMNILITHAHGQEPAP